jgi:formate dehydrogenase maturation protein FdhE
LAQTCKQCRGYIKTLRAEGSIPHDLLSIEDLATLYIDQGCQQQGYTRFGHNPGAPPPT